MRKYLLVLISTILLLSGCARSTLTVRSDYFSRKNLASVIVDTPDPRKDNPHFGQRLFILWALTPSDFRKDDVKLNVIMRFKNGQEKQITYPITTLVGTKLIIIDGEDFTIKGGLESYLVSLYAGKNLIKRSRHKFWIDKIEVK